ncbi:MAG: hypothetical protein Q7W02_06380 [Candidatus Rokubacteria bacterium]|nr:hypothetical protein [Candidatus Rokubacteria bacterium]
MNSTRIPPAAFELRPVEPPWLLRLPRRLHGFRQHSGSEQPIFLPEDEPGSTLRGGLLKYVRFVEGKGKTFLAVLYLQDRQGPGYDVVLSQDGRVTDAVHVGPHGAALGAYLARAEAVNVEFRGHGLSQDVISLAGLRAQAGDADLALACAVADRAARRVARARKVERPAEAWLRRQLEGLGEP